MTNEKPTLKKLCPNTLSDFSLHFKFTSCISIAIFYTCFKLNLVTANYSIIAMVMYTIVNLSCYGMGLIESWIFINESSVNSYNILSFNANINKLKATSIWLSYIALLIILLFINLIS